MSDEFFNLFKSNRHEILTKENDFLGTIPKGEMIKDFIEKISDNEEAQIQMIALYGDWGSGKTSLMRWIEKNLCKDNFTPIFFEAWQHENDDNMALSIVDVISTNISVEYKNMAKEVCLALGALLKGVAKSITIGVPNVPVKMIVEKIVLETEKYLEADNSTFYIKIEKFKNAYKKLENSILGDNNKKKLVIFIDDLDRCEPENVLTLLSAIKLFFTYGQKTIFICGLDKGAVNKAILTKYKDAVKADEYMEKVFDVSFNMPKSNIEKMIKYYLPDLGHEEINSIIRFFNQIGFTNPRHIKKVLNKYLLIRYYRKERIGNSALIPDINNEFFRILVFLIIIIYDFERDNFEIIKNYEEKLIIYGENILNSTERDPTHLVRGMLIENARVITIAAMHGQKQYNQNYEGIDNDEMKHLRFTGAFITIFSPIIKNYLCLDTKNYLKYSKQFCKEKSYLSLFCSYLYDNNFIIPNDDHYILWDIFEMAETYL